MIPAVMPTYGRWDVAVERAEGPHLYATDGRKFLDFTSGIAVTGLGHCHPHVVAAVTEQAKRLWHTSNLFRIPGQEKLAQRLVDKRFNRARYDAESTVAAFADAMRSSADLPGVQRELVATVNQAFEPVHVSVWVNGS